MAESGLPASLILEVVTPDGLLLREEVDELTAPGEQGYFGVRPGHTPFLSTLGLGEISYGRGGERFHLTCFWGFCEVLGDRVNMAFKGTPNIGTKDYAAEKKALRISCA